MSAVEYVWKTFPPVDPNLELMPFQKEVVELSAPLDWYGFYLDQGTGKTLTSLTSALYKLGKGMVDCVVVLMPPILIDNWTREISRFQGTSVLEYRGDPKQRKAMTIGSKQFTTMGYQIFIRDFPKILKDLAGKRVLWILDEATAIKNVSTKTHRCFSEISVGNSGYFLSGTPVNSPLDSYAYIKFLVPGAYRSATHFENMHMKVISRFDKTYEWINLELMNTNMQINSSRVLRHDVLHDLPDMRIDPLPYTLSPEHYALYEQLANERLLVLENSGGKIDATNVNALYHQLQKIIINYGYFADDPSKVPAGLELIEQHLESLGGTTKLLIGGIYQTSNRYLLEALKPYGARVVMGGMTPAQRKRSIDDFIERDDVRVIIIQPVSGGYGVDGLQHVCHNALFIECPTSPLDFHQTLARLQRKGQRNPVQAYIATAKKTLQVRRQRQLVSNDELVNQVIRGMDDLRASIFGD